MTLMSISGRQKLSVFNQNQEILAENLLTKT
ncbi:hypothetical protein Cal7507_3909 [Calothrix sp. PCC 7507]|nr:hypothetical protein Cal7507_3909 [Calothrix sp. PCC 7507]